MTEYGTIRDGVLRTAFIDETEEVQEGWFPVDEIDEERTRAEEGFFVRVSPFVNDGRISFNYEVVVDTQAVRRMIEEQKALLSASDYKVMKCYEASIAGEEMPYDIDALHAERNRMRERVNELEKTL